MPIKEIYPYRCIGCGVCIQSCMCDVIRMKKGKALITYPEDCIECMLCEMDCPRNAIFVQPQPTKFSGKEFQTEFLEKLNY